MVPDELRGRVMAVYSMMFMGMAPFGALLSGAIAQHVGAPLTRPAGRDHQFGRRRGFRTEMAGSAWRSAPAYPGPVDGGGDPPEEMTGQAVSLERDKSTGASTDH